MVEVRTASEGIGTPAQSTVVAVASTVEGTIAACSAAAKRNIFRNGESVHYCFLFF